MPYLSLSGIPLNVEQLRYEPTLLGQKTRAFSGFPMSSVRRTLMMLTGTHGMLKLAEAFAMRSLINGDGHSWTFDSSTASATGLLPTSTTGTVSVVAGSNVYGTGRLQLSPGAVVTWPLTALGDTSTIGMWVRAPALNSNAWTHLVHFPEGDGFVYLNGVLAYPEAGALRDVTGISLPGEAEALSIGYAAGFAGTMSVDDLVYLPYRVPVEWLLPWRNAGAAFGPLPYHRATGTGLHKPIRVLGNAKGGTAMEWFSGGTFVQGESFDFELLEAP